MLVTPLAIPGLLESHGNLDSCCCGLVGGRRRLKIDDLPLLIAGLIEIMLVNVHAREYCELLSFL